MRGGQGFRGKGTEGCCLRGPGKDEGWEEECERITGGEGGMGVRNSEYSGARRAGGDVGNVGDGRGVPCVLP